MATQEVVTPPKQTALEVVEKRLLASMQGERMKAILADGLDPKKLVSLIVSQARTNGRLMECFDTEAGQLSVLEALSKAGQAQLEPDGVQGALVPFKNKRGEMLATFIPMYQGLLALVLRGGVFTRFSARAVYEADEFDVEMGTNERIHHRPALGERGRVIAYYFIAWPKDGSAPHFDWMTLDDVLEIKRRSKAADSGPWVSDFDEMGKKTVCRRALKTMPKDARTAQIMREMDEAEFDGPSPALESSRVPERQTVGLAGITAQLQAKKDARKVMPMPAPEPEPSPDDDPDADLFRDMSSKVDPG